MATKDHPKYYLTPGTLSGHYMAALREAGHGEVRGWHCPNGNDVFVEMTDGKHFRVGMAPGNVVAISSVD